MGLLYHASRWRFTAAMVLLIVCGVVRSNLTPNREIGNRRRLRRQYQRPAVAETIVTETDATETEVAETPAAETEVIETLPTEVPGSEAETTDSPAPETEATGTPGTETSGAETVTSEVSPSSTTGTVAIEVGGFIEPNADNACRFQLDAADIDNDQRLKPLEFSIFLRLASGGAVNKPFVELSAIFVLIYYSAACTYCYEETGDQTCCVGDKAAVNLNSDVPVDFVCRNSATAIIEDILAPTEAPITVTQSPSDIPSTTAPSAGPSLEPTITPFPTLTLGPSGAPSGSPSLAPTTTSLPTVTPVPTITLVPSVLPSTAPSPGPTLSAAPTETAPSEFPSQEPSLNPSNAPSTTPSSTSAPTELPSSVPTETPSTYPSEFPSTFPSISPTVTPTTLPTAPTNAPSQAPVETTTPTITPSTAGPTMAPSTASPSMAPSTASPSMAPSTASPSMTPSTASTTIAPSTASPSIAPSTASPTRSPVDLACVTFGYSLRNQAGLNAMDIFNELNNTVKADLITATNEVVKSIVSQNFAETQVAQDVAARSGRHGGGRRLEGVDRAMELAIVDLLGKDTANKMMAAYQGNVMDELPGFLFDDRLLLHSRKRHLVFYSDEYPTEILAILDEPFCPSENPSTRCALVSSRVCVVLEEGDDEAFIRSVLLAGLREAINNGFETAIPLLSQP